MKTITYNKCLDILRNVKKELGNIKFSSIRTYDTYFRVGKYRLRLDDTRKEPLLVISYHKCSIDICTNYIEFTKNFDNVMCPSSNQFWNTNKDINLDEIGSEEEFFQLSLMNDFDIFEYETLKLAFELRDAVFAFRQSDIETLDAWQMLHNRNRARVR